MKKFAVLLLLAAAAYAGTAYVFGGQIRDRYFSALEENGGGMVALSNQSYERGLFSSRALTIVELRVPGEPGDGAQVRTPRFAVRHIFRHGPFPDPAAGFRPVIARVDSTVEPAADGGEFSEVFREVPALTRTNSSVRVGLDGTVAGDLLVPAVEIRGDKGRFSWSGLTATASQDPSTGALRGEYSAGGLLVETPDGTLTLEGFTGSFDVAETMPLIYLGHVEGGLTALNARGFDGDPVSVTGMSFSSDSGMVGNMIHYRQKLGIERVEAGGLVCGPVACDMEAGNVDASALSEFQAGIRELYRPGMDAAALTQKTEALYVRFFDRLLAGSPEFRVHALKVPTSIGDMDASLDVRIDAAGGASSANVLQLLRGLDAAAELRMDESLLVGLARMDLEAKGASSGDLDSLARRIVAGQIGPLVARNLVVREEGAFRTSAVLRRGRLQVNGRETPLF